MDKKLAIALFLGLGVGAFFLIKEMKGSQTTEEILDELFPGGFTASSAQLDILIEAGYPNGSRVYNEAIHIAYDRVAASCTDDEVVSWSAELGYYCTIP
jgi:hypothetical protein